MLAMLTHRVAFLWTSHRRGGKPPRNEMKIGTRTSVDNKRVHEGEKT